MIQIVNNHTNISFNGVHLLGKCSSFLSSRAHYSIAQMNTIQLRRCLIFMGSTFQDAAELESAKTGIKGDSLQTFIKLVKLLGFTMANTPTEHAINLEAMIAEASYY